VVAVDLSPEAISVARDNAGRLAAAVDFRQGDWFAPVAGERFDLIAANPPLRRRRRPASDARWAAFRAATGADRRRRRPGLHPPHRRRRARTI
jgi:16S rRNA G1207 methylase RsmC